MEQIKAKIIAHSISLHSGVEVVTFELEYPRFIHAEFMTHRVFSRNAASSRAIPINKVIEQVYVDPAMPVYWGKNKAGMQAIEELSEDERDIAISYWKLAANSAVFQAENLQGIDLHKQLVNRVLEPFQMIKVVVTSTEWKNFFHLRYHPAAQPEIQRLAELMHNAMIESISVTLGDGEWHLPYIDAVTRTFLGTENSKILSASLCAQVSYRKADDSLEKATDIFNKLMNGDVVHASPVEHQVMAYDGSQMNYYPGTWLEGVTHMDRKGWYWSGNIRGFIQWRQLIPNNNQSDYE